MKKRRLAAELLSGVLAAQAVLSAMPIHAVSVGAGDLRPGGEVTKDPSATRFTNTEWTGTDYEEDGATKNTVDIFEVNRESASTNIIPYHDDASAQNGVWNYDGREDSNYLQMLTGEGETWQLNVVQNPEEAAAFEGENGFTKQSFSNNAWKNVTLPCSWTMQGFDFSIYTNQTIPWQTKYGDLSSPRLAPAAPTNYNPVGMYRKTFTLKPGMMDESRRVYINFQGVESAYYVYINGHEVGYSEDTFSPHKFDITDFLVEGENFLAVKVLKFSDAVWMEDQDMIYDGGIFRDVYVTAAPLAQISDYKYVTDLDDDYVNATLNLAVDVTNLSTTNLSGWSVDAAVYDAAGTNVIASNTDASASVSVNSESKAAVSISTQVTAPKLWSAEDPNLYALVLHLKDADGNVVETLSTQLGFREIEYTQTQVDANGNTTTTQWDPVTINGKRLLCKGADRHDSDPVYGKATPKASIEEDLKLMKQNNLNAIRTSHYSNDDYLYWLANKWGLYIMAETNVESHCFMSDGWFGEQNTGIASQYKAKFRNMIMDREVTAYERLKNNPSVVMWSLGNETARPYVLDDAGGAFKDSMAFFKREDPTRPVLFESFGSNMGGDIHGEQYPGVEYAASWAGEGRLPYVLTEFVHSMGNSTGHLSEYMDIIRPTSNMVGCFIWDWVDQSRYKSLDDLFAGWVFADETHGLSGTASGDRSDLITTDGAQSLNGGKAFAGGILVDQNDALDAALSGSGKAFTLEINVKPNSAGNDDVYLTKGDNQFALKTNKSNQLEFFVFDSTWRASTWDLPANWAGNWQHIVLTYNAGVRTLYINGEKIGESKSGDNITIASSSDKIGIGKQDGMSGRSSNGQIAFARIYNKALSAAEVSGQHSATPAIGKDDPSVLLWADFSEASTLVDNSASYWDYYSTDEAHAGMYKEEAAGKFLAYGGDWGDRPNDGNFCANGLVSADRDPQPELNEVKFQYQNLWFTATDLQVASRKVTVYNENRFADLNTYDLRWEVLEDGVVVKSGSIPTTSLAGLETAEISVPYEMPETVKDGHEYLLNVRALTKTDQEWAKAGHELSYAQFVIPTDTEQAAPMDLAGSVSVAETDAAYNVSGNGFSFSVNKNSGQMVNYVFHNETLIKEGPMPYFWRCRTDNDSAEGGNSYYDNGWRTAMDEGNYTVSLSASEVDGKHVITANYTLTSMGNTSVRVIYTIDGNGAVTMNIKADATSSGKGNFISVGSNMLLPEGYENVTWYADGPDETLADRMTSARATKFSKSVSANFYPYIKIDDTGTYPETRWMRISSDSHANDVLVVARDTVQTSALHFTAEQLENALHPYELSPLKDTVVGINFGSKGTGGATCGAGTRTPYLMPSSRVYEWEFTLLPVAKSSTDISAATTTYHDAEIVPLGEVATNEAKRISDAIDAFLPVAYNQLDAAKELKAEYDALPDEVKALISDDRKEKVNGLVAAVEAFREANAILRDKSANHLDVPVTDTMDFAFEPDGTAAMSGYGDIGHNNVIAPVFAAGNSWTMETVIIPTSLSGQKTLLSKGDYLTTLRQQNANLSFHISNGSNWYASDINDTTAFTQEEVDNFIGKPHRVTAVYDYTGGNLSIYYDGALHSTKSVGQVSVSESVNTANNLWIGVDPQNMDRVGNAKYVSVRLFNKALSAQEAATSLRPESTNTVLWLDMDSFSTASALDLSQLELATAKAEEAIAHTDEFASVSDTVKNAPATLAAVKRDSALGTVSQADINAKAAEINQAVLALRYRPDAAKLNALN